MCPGMWDPTGNGVRGSGNRELTPPSGFLDQEQSRFMSRDVRQVSDLRPGSLDLQRCFQMASVESFVFLSELGLL